MVREKIDNNLNLLLRDIVEVERNIEIDSDIVKKIYDSIFSASRVFFIGNGGSLAACEHISNDLVKRCNKESYTLSNISLATCLANDYGYENIYSEFLCRYNINSKDIVIAISSSGKSENIANGVFYALNRKAKVLSLYGFDKSNHKYVEDIDYYIYIPTYSYGVAEMYSEIFLHNLIEIFCDGLRGDL